MAVVLLLAAAPDAAAQPTLTKIFTPDTIGPGSVSTTTFTITNGSGAPVTGLAFTDNLPAAVTIADPAAASTTCDLGVSGTLDAPDGGSTITLSDAQLSAFASCTVTVSVTSSTPGMHTNPAITLSSDAGSSMSGAVDLTVDAGRPGFSKSFSPASVTLGDRSTLTFTIDNSANGGSANNLTFSDPLPVGLEVADPAAASTTCTSGLLVAVPGTTVVGLSGGSVSASSSCTVAVDVVATGAGALENTSGELTSFEDGSCGKAAAVLDVTADAVTLIKEFVDDPVPPGGTVTLELTVLNFDRSFSATGVSFSDDLNSALPGLTFETQVSNTCGGEVTGEGTTFLSLSNGTVAPEGSCSLVVELTVPVTTPGTYVNTTSTVTATVDGSPVVGNMASDTLFVEPVPIFTKEFIDDPVNAGEMVTLRFTITNTDPTSTLTGLEFTDDIGGVDDGSGTRAGAVPGMAANSLVDMSGLAPDPLVDVCGVGSELTIPDPNDTLPSPPFPNLPPDPTLLVFTGGSLAPAGSPGDSCTFDVVLDVPVGVAAATYLNTTTDLTDGATSLAPPATDGLVIVAAPNLTKEFLDDPVPPGGTVTLEFTLSHSAEAPAAATGITFTDDLATVLTDLVASLPPDPDPPCGAGSSLTGSAGDTLLTLLNGSLQPGESCTFRVLLDVPTGAAPGTYPNTTSGVAATVDGVAVTAAPASDDLRIAGLTFTKEFVGDPVVPGETVTLRFTLENTDPTDDASSIQFSDDLAAVLPGVPDLTVVPPLPTTPCGPSSSITGTSSLSFSGGELTQGNMCTFDVLLQVPAGAPDGDHQNLTSSLSAILGGSGVSIDPAVDTLTVDPRRLLLTKEFLDDPVAPGDSVTLRFTLTNLDATNAASSVAFTDDLDAVLPDLVATGLPSPACGGTASGTSAIDFSGGSLAPGAQCSFDVTLDVPGDAVAGTYPNTTSDVTGLISGLAVTGDPASDELAVFDLIDFSKSFDGPTVAGGTAVLSFTLTNPGANAASGLGFTDDLDAVIPGLLATNLPLVDVCGAGSVLSGPSLLTLTGGSLPPSGGSCTLNVELQVPPTADPGSFPNTSSELFQSGLVVSDPATAVLVIEPPPTFDKSFTPNAVGLGFTSVLTLTIDNTASSLAATDLDFTDNLPAGLLVATPPNASTTCTGGTFTAAAGTTVITYTNGGTVGAGASCTLEVDVVTTATGFLNNTTGDLTSSSGNSGTAQAILAVDPPPVYSKSFAPTNIAIDGLSTLTFTIDNTFATVDATGLDFTDNLPAAVVIATPGNPSTDCTGGTLTADDGTAVITYTGGTVTAGTSCTVDVDVTSSAVGTHQNVSGQLTSSLGSSGSANASLTVEPPPLFSKAFAPDPSVIGGVVTLTFTIDNTASTLSATGLAFTDNLPAGLVVATPANAMKTCTDGMVSAGSGTISYDGGGTVSASSICTISVDVTSTAAGDYINTTGDLTSSLGNSGPAEASLRVNPPPVFSKAFVPSSILVGDTTTLVFSIDNAASTADATGLDFTDNLPAEITIADPANVTTDCDGGLLTAVEGTTTIAYTGGIVTAGASCTVSVDTTSVVLGMHDNVSGELTSSLGSSGTAEAALTVEDLEPPVVTSVVTAAGPLSTCDTVRSPISTIDVTVTDDRTPVLLADSASSYLLVEAGADGDFSTADCSGASGDDTEVSVLGVTVDATDPLAVIASVGVAGGNGLVPGLYRLFVCDTITDSAGNALDGNGDMIAGGDFEVPFFRADPGNLLANGHFDDCPATLAPWTLTEVPPNSLQVGAPGTDDSDGSPLSTSARLVQSDFPSSSLAQCVTVGSDQPHDLACRVRLVTPMGALAIFGKSCEFFDGAGCTGTSLGETSVTALLEDNGGTWIETLTSLQSPVGAASALCSFEGGPVGSDPQFDLFLDGLFFGLTAQIFADGFESGDTSAWSSAVP